MLENSNRRKHRRKVDRCGPRVAGRACAKPRRRERQHLPKAGAGAPGEWQRGGREPKQDKPACRAAPRAGAALCRLLASPQSAHGEGGAIVCGLGKSLLQLEEETGGMDGNGAEQGSGTAWSPGGAGNGPRSCQDSGQEGRGWDCTREAESTGL